MTTEQQSNSYHVTWEIDVEAAGPREAAEKALTIQRDPESTATVFDVRLENSHDDPKRIDLAIPVLDAARAAVIDACARHFMRNPITRQAAALHGFKGFYAMDSAALIHYAREAGLHNSTPEMAEAIQQLS